MDHHRELNLIGEGPRVLKILTCDVSIKSSTYFTWKFRVCLTQPYRVSQDTRGSVFN